MNRGYWQYVTSKTPALPSQPSDAQKKAHADFVDKSQKARALIGLCVEDYHLPVIMDAANAKAAWDALANMYAQQSLANLVNLKRSFQGLALSPLETITVYLGRAQELVSQLKAVGQTVDEQDMVLQVLTGLPEDYKVVTTILENGDKSALTMSNVRAKLLLGEVRIQRSKEVDNTASNTTEMAMLSKVHKGDKTKGRKAYQRQRKCYKCGGLGHMARECPSPSDLSDSESETDLEMTHKALSASVIAL